MRINSFYKGQAEQKMSKNLLYGNTKKKGKMLIYMKKERNWVESEK